MMPIIDEFNTRLAETIAFLGLGAAIAWRQWLKLRRDTREDGAGEVSQRTFKSIIKEQTDHIARLEKRLDAAEERAEYLEEKIQVMADRVNEEISRRYVAEAAVRRMDSEANGLRAAVADLTERLTSMGLKLGDKNL